MDFITVSNNDSVFRCFVFFVFPRFVFFSRAHTFCQLYKNIELSYGWSVGSLSLWRLVMHSYYPLLESGGVKAMIL